MMQKKIYIGGLPWEIDRIGLLNYFKAVLEESDITASYELPFVTTPLVNPNSTLRVVDVFVALDKQTNKSRGFGFITIDFVNAEDADQLFDKIVELFNERVMIGIRGPRDLIVKEADPRPSDRDNGDDNSANEEDSSDEDSDEDAGNSLGLDW